MRRILLMARATIIQGQFQPCRSARSTAAWSSWLRSGKLGNEEQAEKDHIRDERRHLEGSLVLDLWSTGFRLAARFDIR